MNASMVRMGGIAVFVMIAIAIIGGFVVRGSATGGIILNIINTLLLLFVLWTTKGFLNSQNYSRADVFLLIIMAGIIVMFVLGLISGSGGMGMMAGRTGAAAMGVVGIIVLIIMLIVLICGIIMSLRFIDYGKAGGGVWKAVGILYLIAQICLVIMVVLFLIAALAKSLGLIGVAGILGLIGGLVALAALIVHGIALIMGAGKMGGAAAAT